MAGKKKHEFKEGDQVVACPIVMQCPNKSGQLMSRTGLNADQLREGPMHVVRARDDGQLEVRHPRLGRPFIVHSKFITQMSGATA